LALGAIPAFAGSTIGDYKNAMASENPARISLMKQYVLGVGDGLGWGSAGSKEELFCPPPKLTLTLDNYINILNSHIRDLDRLWANETEKVDRRFIGLVLLEALRETFPCKGK
jgi:hypothetical protein